MRRHTNVGRLRAARRFGNLNVLKKFGSPALYLFLVVNITFFAWIPDSGSIFKVRSDNFFVRKSKAGVLHITK